jgi:hypothetical protein
MELDGRTGEVPRFGFWRYTKGRDMIDLRQSDRLVGFFKSMTQSRVVHLKTLASKLLTQTSNPRGEVSMGDASFPSLERKWELETIILECEQAVLNGSKLNRFLDNNAMRRARNRCL